MVAPLPAARHRTATIFTHLVTGLKLTLLGLLTDLKLTLLGWRLKLVLVLALVGVQGITNEWRLATLCWCKDRCLHHKTVPFYNYARLAEYVHTLQMNGSHDPQLREHWSHDTSTCSISIPKMDSSWILLTVAGAVCTCHKHQWTAHTRRPPFLAASGRGLRRRSTCALTSVVR